MSILLNLKQYKITENNRKQSISVTVHGKLFYIK